MRDLWLYRAITGEAASLLYENRTEEEVQELLWKKYIDDTGAIKNAKMTSTGENLSRSTKEMSQQLWQIFCDRWIRQGKSYSNFKRGWEKRSFFNAEKFQSRQGMDRS